MAKVQLLISIIFILFISARGVAQNNYQLKLRSVDKDSAMLGQILNGTPTNFPDRDACRIYINKLIPDLQSKGYVTSSLDSVQYDSLFARVVLFVGDSYKWAVLNTKNVDKTILEAVGWQDKQFAGKPIDFIKIQNWEEQILNYLENNGHPFGRVYLDSLKIEDEKVSAKLKVEKGPLYKIDSIRVYGEAKVSNVFLQRYLDIKNGSIYNKSKLQQISKKMLELTYVEEERPSNLSRLATGSVLNLYLKPKRSSQFNVLLGFLPNTDQLSSKKLLVTGEANIHLRNALGNGEAIGLDWQQLQAKSPRLNIIFQQPYLFNSPVGLDFSFDMYRKDSTYLNVNLQLGAQYVLSSFKTGKLFIQRFQTILNNPDTATIILYHQLPDVADVSSTNLGVEYQFNNTNYHLNPRRGNELEFTATAGTKMIKKNSQVLELQDPNNPTFKFESLYDTMKLKTYQFRIRATAAKYFPVGKQGTFKTALNAGVFQSGNVFRNELFQIGGYKLLRGFDEESQYLSQFVIGTVEYHYLIGLNSYFYVLADGGWGKNNSFTNNLNYTYFGTGLGLAFQTKAGIFNLAWAVGKRNDTELNLRQSKIHFGFVNYF